MTSNITRSTEIVIRRIISEGQAEFSNGFGWSDLKWLFNDVGPAIVACYEGIVKEFRSQKAAEIFIRDGLDRTMEILAEENIYKPGWFIRTFVIPFVKRAAASNLASLVKEK